MTSYTVIYRTGGRMVNEWRKCLPVTSRSSAQVMRDMIVRGGRKALIKVTADLDVTGLPEGWGPE